ncbi:MAG: hypothetical protein F4Y85_13815 [Gammaproteobacteria bacterium]|nr:hypothetical protein [Gammaproteobacteria bacterium]
MKGFEVYLIDPEGRRMDTEVEPGEFSSLDQAINCVVNCARDLYDDGYFDRGCGMVIHLKRSDRPAASSPRKAGPCMGERAYRLKRDTAMSWGEIAEELGYQGGRGNVPNLAKGWAERHNLPWPIDRGPSTWW